MSSRPAGGIGVRAARKGARHSGMRASGTARLAPQACGRRRASFKMFCLTGYRNRSWLFLGVRQRRPPPRPASAADHCLTRARTFRQPETSSSATVGFSPLGYCTRTRAGAVVVRQGLGGVGEALRRLDRRWRALWWKAAVRADAARACLLRGRARDGERARGREHALRGVHDRGEPVDHAAEGLLDVAAEEEARRGLEPPEPHFDRLRDGPPESARRPPPPHIDDGVGIAARVGCWQRRRGE